MARISPTLRTLLESGAVVFCSTDAKKIESYKRREPLKWLLRQSDGSTVAVTTTIERMSQRAGAGLSFDARAMKKVARGVTQVHLTAASAAVVAPAAARINDPFVGGAAKRVDNPLKRKPVEVAAPKTPPSPKDFDVITLFDVRLPLVGRLEVKDSTSKSPIVQFSLRLRSSDEITAFAKIRERVISGNPVPVAHPILSVNGISTVTFTKDKQLFPFTFALEGTGQKAAAPKPAPKRKTAAAVKASTAKDSAAAKAAEVVPATTPLKDATSPRAHVIFLVDRSPSMQLENRMALAKQQLEAIVASLSPDALIDLYDFASEVKLHALQCPAKVFKLGTAQTGSSTALYTALEKGLTSALGYVQTGASVLLYLLTDGENNGPVIDVAAKVKQLLATDKATIAAIGPKSALSFFSTRRTRRLHPRLAGQRRRSEGCDCQGSGGC